MSKFKHKIRKRYIKNPELLAVQLEALMVEHGHCAHRAVTNDRRYALTDKRANEFNEGVAAGLDKAWKLIFGIESFKDLKANRGCDE